MILTFNYFFNVICLCLEMIFTHFEHKVLLSVSVNLYIIILYYMCHHWVLQYFVRMFDRCTLYRPCYIGHKNSITFLYWTSTVSICLPWNQLCSVYANAKRLVPSIVISLTTTFWKNLVLIQIYFFIRWVPELHG